MTISSKYFDYLDIFPETKTVSTLFSQGVSSSNIVALRHDIDHDLDIALDLAYAEYKRGYQATYYVLHDHKYNRDELFLDKLLQLQDYGHEIGIHLNVLAGWVAGNFDEPSSHLHVWLERLRAAGINITGCATHGDKGCYEIGAVNNWFFKEQKKSRKDYIPITPEGVIDHKGNNLISFPDSTELRREDGLTLGLWQASMSDFGLEYEAVDLPGKYWSDTGKDWHRTGDPMGEDLRTGLHQVLMHPIHWLGEPRTIFFLSTARVGSKWCSKAIDVCTSANVQHEWSLNHRQRNGKNTQEKLTTLDIEALENKPDYVQRLLDYSSRFNFGNRKDRVEFNVYLVDHIDQLRSAFPKAEIFGLTRDPFNVTASLLSRGWYSSPNTIRHPNNAAYRQAGLNQFQKSCRYWFDVNETLLSEAREVFRIEDIGSSPEQLYSFLESIGMPVHKRLCEKVNFSPLDPTIKSKLDPYATLSLPNLNTIREHCGSLMEKLGYSLNAHQPDKLSVFLNQLPGYKSINALLDQLHERSSKALSKKANKVVSTPNFECFNTSAGVEVMTNNNGTIFRFPAQVRNAWILFDQLGNSTWSKLNHGSGLTMPKSAVVFEGSISFKLEGDLSCRLFYLEYSADGHLVDKKVLTLLAPGWRGRFSELVTPSKNRFCLGVHISSNDESGERSLHIGKLSASFRALPYNYIIDGH